VVISGSREDRYEVGGGRGWRLEVVVVVGGRGEARRGGGREKIQANTSPRQIYLDQRSSGAASSL
jgi:hypothetical protein